MRYTLVALSLLAGATFCHAQQTCQVIANQVYCSGGQLQSSQNIGNTTYYNYNNQQQAQRQGLPTTSQQIGNTRFYDNGVTRQTIGNTDFYSNGVTKQRIGDVDFYSNGKTCQTIGTTQFCN